MLIYLSRLYEKEFADNGKRIYNSSRTDLPVPKFIVFYNGREKEDEERIIYISDAFSDPDRSDIDMKVRIININYGHNKKLMEACSI